MPESKISIAPNPATIETEESAKHESGRIIFVGNIGHSQGLEAVVDAFEASTELSDAGNQAPDYGNWRRRKGGALAN